MFCTFITRIKDNKLAKKVCRIFSKRVCILQQTRWICCIFEVDSSACQLCSKSREKHTRVRDDLVFSRLADETVTSSVVYFRLSAHRRCLSSCVTSCRIGDGWAARYNWLNYCFVRWRSWWWLGISYNNLLQKPVFKKAFFCTFACQLMKPLLSDISWLVSM